MEDYREQSPCVSDDESVVSGGRSHHHLSPVFYTPGISGSESSLIRLGEQDRAHTFIKQRFVSSLGLQPPAEVVTIYRRNWSISSAQATLLAFQIYLRAFATKNSGDPNVKYAWYGTSKDGIRKIIAHGFGHEEINRTSGGALYGRGVYLSPYHSPLASVESSVEDEDGLRHILLCKVLLGNVEAVQAGSDQVHPSSDRFDSGVDSVVSPKKYIMWSTNMNTHILPEFIVSFRMNSKLPPIRRSPWMSFSALFQALSGFLDPHVMTSINVHYKEFTEKRISRDELVRSIRRVAGDELLASIINSSNL